MACSRSITSRAAGAGTRTIDFSEEVSDSDQAGELNARLERYVTESGYDLPEARTADDADPEAASTATPTPETIGDGRGESEVR